MPRRVLHVLATNERRGAEVFAADLADALGTHGCTSNLVAIAASTSTATVDATPLGDGLDLGVVRKLRRLAADHDVVVAHGSTSLPACAAACLGVAPFVYRSIGDPAYWSAAGIRRLQTRLLLGRARRVVTLWEGAAQTLEHRGLPRPRLDVIPNAVHADRFPLVSADVRREARQALDLTEADPVILYLGALSSEKRPDRAVALGAARADYTVLLVGDGPARASVEAASRPLANVRVVGPSSEPHRYLAAADVVIVPSDTEGIPAVAIEAGLSGLPVVASDVGGLSAVIDQGRTGYLIAPGDDDTFAERVDDALAARPEMGQRARAHCLERFDIAAVARQWADVIERVARSTTGT